MSISKSPYIRGTLSQADSESISTSSATTPFMLSSIPTLSSLPSFPSIPSIYDQSKCTKIPRYQRPKNHCRRCLLYFECGQALYAHIRQVHWTKTKCSPCGAQFSSDRSLNRHTERVHTRPAHLCRFCGMEFKLKRYLRRHIDRQHRRVNEPQNEHHHHGRKQCNICKKWFPDSYGLRVHQRTHSGEKPLECNVCLKSFADPSGLRRHKQRYHSKKKMDEDIQEIKGPPLILEKPKKGSKQCVVCKKWFCDSYRLKIHQRTHSGEKPLKCRECGKRLGDPSNLRQHIKRHHPMKEKENDLHECDLCDAVIGRNSDFQKHVVEVHGGVVLDI